MYFKFLDDFDCPTKVVNHMVSYAHATYTYLVGHKHANYYVNLKYDDKGKLIDISIIGKLIQREITDTFTIIEIYQKLKAFLAEQDSHLHI